MTRNNLDLTTLVEDIRHYCIDRDGDFDSHQCQELIRQALSTRQPDALVDALPFDMKVLFEILQNCEPQNDEFIRGEFNIALCQVRNALAKALATRPAVPEGWVLVEQQPSFEVLAAGVAELPAYGKSYTDLRKAWDAMLAASRKDGGC